MFSWFKGEEKPKIDPTEFHQPESYKGGEGPMFKVMKDESTEDYETRIYKQTNWVSSRMDTSNYDDAGSKLFWKLFGYIGGKNEKKTKIAMTTPVRSKVEIGEDNDIKSMTMSFFTSPSQLPNPPAADDETVFHEENPEMKVYATSFGGFAKAKDWRENFEKLKTALGRDGKEFVKGYYYTAGYDPPFRLWGRVNEIMLVAASDE